MKVHGGIGFTQEAILAELQMAYALSDKFGVMLNGVSYNEDDSQASPARDKGRMIELGLGYSQVLKEIEKHPQNKVVWEIYAGHGIGNAEVNTSNRLTSFNLNRSFIQPAIGFQTPYFDMALSCRAALANFGKLRYFNHPTDNYTPYPLDKRDKHFLLEPAISLRAGYKFIKFQSQVVYSNTINSDLPQDHLLFSGMLIFDLKMMWNN